MTADPSKILRIEPAVPGKAEWRDPVTLRFTPARPLTAGTTYKVTIDTGFTAMDGARLAAPHSWSFRVRGPQLLTGIPVGPGYYGDRDRRTSSLVQPRDTFVLILSREVPRELVERATYLEVDRACASGRQVIKLGLAAQSAIATDASWQLRLYSRLRVRKWLPWSLA